MNKTSMIIASSLLAFIVNTPAFAADTTATTTATDTKVVTETKGGDDKVVKTKESKETKVVKTEKTKKAVDGKDAPKTDGDSKPVESK